MESINWTQEQMLEVTLKEPDDFLKVRETLSRIGVDLEKKEHYINHVISCISKVDTLLCILKNYLHLTVKTQTYQKMTLQEEIRLQIF